MHTIKEDHSNDMEFFKQFIREKKYNTLNRKQNNQIEYKLT